MVRALTKPPGIASSAATKVLDVGEHLRAEHLGRGGLTMFHPAQGRP